MQQLKQVFLNFLDQVDFFCLLFAGCTEKKGVPQLQNWLIRLKKISFQMTTVMLFLLTVLTDNRYAFFERSRKFE